MNDIAKAAETEFKRHLQMALNRFNSDTGVDHYLQPAMH